MAHGVRSVIPQPDPPTVRDENLDLPGVGARESLGQRGRAPRTLKIPFSSVPSESSQGTGTPFPVQGRVFALNPASDPLATLLVGVDDADPSYRLTRGQKHTIKGGDPFQTLYLLRPAALPSDTGRYFILDVFWDATDVQYDAASAQAPQGSDNGLVTRNTSGLGTTVLAVAARAGRKRFLLRNLDPANDLYFDFSAGTADTAALPIRAGEWFSLDYEGGIYLAAQAAATPWVCVEVY